MFTHTHIFKQKKTSHTQHRARTDQRGDVLTRGERDDGVGNQGGQEGVDPLVPEYLLGIPGNFFVCDCIGERGVC